MVLYPILAHFCSILFCFTLYRDNVLVRWCLMVHCFVCCFFESTTWKPKLTSIVKDSCTDWLALQHEAPSSSQAFKWLPCFFLCSHRNKVQALFLWHTHTHAQCLSSKTLAYIYCLVWSWGPNGILISNDLLNVFLLLNNTMIFFPFTFGPKALMLFAWVG